MNSNTKHLLSTQAYRLIKADIVTCTYAPGQFIAQADLVKNYQVGTTPVREALRQLAQEGFVQAVPRLGYIVSPITVQNVHEIYEMRAILETASVRLAAKRAPLEQLRQLADSAHFTYTYKDRLSYTQFLQRNAEFHQAIAAAAGNQRLTDQVGLILDALNRVFHLGLDLKDSAEEMREDHEALSQALLKRDADRADQIIQSEIERSQARVMEALKNVPGAVSSFSLPTFGLGFGTPLPPPKGSD
jgi:DNA-binding GntR family transcriptional regulator